MPISRHQLTPEQLHEVNCLAKRCKQQDGESIPFYPDLLLRYRSLPNNVLYYQKGQLIGFLSVFFFYDEACELVLLVDPAWRRQHIASALLLTILPTIQSRGTPNILFSAPKGKNDTWLRDLGLTYQNSEIQMEWKKYKSSRPTPPALVLSQSFCEADIPTLVKIDMACFHTEEAEMIDRFYRILHDDTYTLFLAHFNNVLIGKAHMHREEGQLQLSDIAILPDYQGRGFGQALVQYCIENAPQSATLPLRLCVVSTNQKALDLYHHLGFKITNSCDFWMIPTHTLCNCISKRN